MGNFFGILHKMKTKFSEPAQGATESVGCERTRHPERSRGISLNSLGACGGRSLSFARDDGDLHFQSHLTVQYEWLLGSDLIDVNAFLNKRISLEITGNIFCIQCGRKTQKSFQQGFCFPCLRRLQECHLCIIHPERCLVEAGGCDPKDWAHQQCNEPHIVYLANTSAIKVGITREKNIPYRWIDQGAVQGLPLFKTTQRALAGRIEVVFKQYVADKTNWREMLKNHSTFIDLISLREELLKKAEADLSVLDKQYPGEIHCLNEIEVRRIQYPVIEYPVKVATLSFEKSPKMTGKLLGIKGQYLIFDTGVLNIRKYGGYEIHIRS